MSQQSIASPNTTVNAPWKQSAKGAVYCMWGSLTEDIKSQLKQEDRFGITLGQYRYNVKQNQDGGFVVFRNTKAEYESNRYKQQSQYFKRQVYRIIEVQVLPIQEANKLLASSEDYELIGTDLTKVVNDELLVILGKKERRNKESETK